MNSNKRVVYSLLLVLLIAGFLFSYYNYTITGMVAGGGKYHYVLENGTEIEIMKLQLNYICSNSGDYDVWRIFNHNKDLGIDYTWEERYGEILIINGSRVANYGKNYFETDKLDMETEMKIFVQGVEHASKKNKQKECEEDSDYINVTTAQPITTSEVITTTTLTTEERTNEIPTTIITANPEETTLAESTTTTTVSETTTEITSELTTMIPTTEESMNEIPSTIIETTIEINTTIINTTEITTSAPAVNNAGGGGGNYIPETSTTKIEITKSEKVNPQIIENTQTSVNNNGGGNTTAQGGGFFRLIGNVIRVPIDGMRNNIGLSVLIFLIILIGGAFGIKYCLKRRKRKMKINNSKIPKNPKHKYL